MATAGNTEEAEVHIKLTGGEKVGNNMRELQATANRVRASMRDMIPGTAEFNKAAKDLAILEGAYGDIQSEIKNVKKAQDLLNESMAEYIPFAGQLQGFVKGYRDLSVTIGTATKGSKLFGTTTKIAIASTGIGLLLIAFGTLYTWLTKTQKGMDFMGKIGASISAVFQILIDRVLAFGKGVFAIFSGNFADGIKELERSFFGLGQELASETKAAWEMEGALQDITRAEKQLEIQRSRSRAEIEKLKMAAEDQTKSEQERLDAAQKAFGLENKLLNDSISLQEKKLKTLKDQNALGTSTDEDLNREYDAEIELNNMREESFTKQTELQNKINELKRSGVVVTKETAEEETAVVKKAKEDQFLVVSENLEKEYQLLGESIRKEQEAKKLSDEQILKDRLSRMDEENQIVQDKIWVQFYEGQVSQEERDRLLHEQQVKALQDRLFTLAMSGETESAEYQKIYTDLAQLHYDYNQKKLESDQRYHDAKKALEQESLAAASDVFGSLADFLSRDEEARRKNFQTIKAMKVAEITASSTAEIMAIWEYANKNPLNAIFPGAAQVIAGVKTVAALLRFGKGVSDIKKTNFAHGGPVFGPSHSMGGIPFSVRGRGGYEMEGGEIIMTKGVYQNPTLRAAASMINVAGGGTSFAMGGPVNPLASTPVNSSNPGTVINNITNQAGQQSDTALVQEVRALRQDVANWQNEFQVKLSLQKLKEAEDRMREVEMDTYI